MRRRGGPCEHRSSCLACDSPIVAGRDPARDALRARLCPGCWVGATAGCAHAAGHVRCGRLIGPAHRRRRTRAHRARCRFGSAAA